MDKKIEAIILDNLANYPELHDMTLTNELEEIDLTYFDRDQLIACANFQQNVIHDLIRLIDEGVNNEN